MEGNLHDNHLQKSAAATALSAATDQELRVPCYCEENVWRLAYRKTQQQAGTTIQYYVVFVSNPSQSVCFFYQRANADPMTPVFWDYHVLLFEHDTTANMVNVLDVDSYLPCPCPLAEYLQQAFPDSTELDPEQLAQISPIFRVVPAQKFLSHFASDRSHMWDAEKRQWRAIPPTYQCIQGAPTNTDGKYNGSNLMTYVDMKQNLENPKFGYVLNRQQLEERFTAGQGNPE
jgi:protein N-terminal glutamine amidohydrolase